MSEPKSDSLLPRKYQSLYVHREEKALAFHMAIRIWFLGQNKLWLRTSHQLLGALKGLGVITHLHVDAHTKCGIHVGAITRGESTSEGLNIFYHLPPSVHDPTASPGLKAPCLKRKLSTRVVLRPPRTLPCTKCLGDGHSLAWSQQPQFFVLLLSSYLHV